MFGLFKNKFLRKSEAKTTSEKEHDGGRNYSKDFPSTQKIEFLPKASADNQIFYLRRSSIFFKLICNQYKKKCKTCPTFIDWYFSEGEEQDKFR